jgi:ankyrin repeat protein
VTSSHLNPDTGDDGRTALHIASKKGYIEIAELLLASGANANVLGMQLL